MNKFYILIYFVLGFTASAQLKEVQKLKNIEKKYDSILVNYQKNAKDSLANLKKVERNKIMALEEAKIVERKKKEEYAQLDKIRKEELELSRKTIPEKSRKCEMDTNFQMPSLLNKLKYKPTIDKTKEKEKKREFISVITFQVTADGYVKNVKATGADEDFNKELELTYYKVEKMTPMCFNGITKTRNFRQPIRANF